MSEYGLPSLGEYIRMLCLNIRILCMAKPDSLVTNIASTYITSSIEWATKLKYFASITIRLKIYRGLKYVLFNLFNIHKTISMFFDEIMGNNYYDMNKTLGF